MLELAVNDSYFTFNDIIYRQKDGVAIRSPLGPIFANIFMSTYEQTWLEEAPVKPLLYRRYVDDTFLIFEATENIEDFVTFLNSQHPNFRFIYEEEIDGYLPFIEITIFHDINKPGFLLTKVYRKPTFTGLYTNFNSNIPALFKLAVVWSLLHRAYQLSTNLLLFHNEVISIRDILHKNGYSFSLLGRCINKYLNKFYSLKVAIFTARKLTLNACIPLLGKQSIALRAKLNRLMAKYYPNIELRVCFKSASNISRLFHVKDATPRVLKSNVVYRYFCADCNAGYIGKTSRHFHVRICEHKVVSCLTGKYFDRPSFSAIREHSMSFAPIALDGFQILARGNTDIELLINESLLIADQRPILNSNISS